MVSFDDRRFKSYALQFGHLQRYVTRRCLEVPLIVPGTVSLSLRCTLIPLRVGQRLCFLVQQAMDGLFHADTHKFFQFLLYPFPRFAV